MRVRVLGGADSNQDPFNFPIKLNNKIAALASTVQDGDGEPTESSYEVFKLLAEKLAVQQNLLDKELKTGLPAVNKPLYEKGLKELSPAKEETK
ncbi:MAG: hypothetical protein ACLPX8_04640 [Bryobacteraceae bacterium]|jgi:hypothetical protein